MTKVQQAVLAAIGGMQEKTEMKGWKTWASAMGLFALGLYLISIGMVELGIQTMLLGGGLIGLGSKVERSTAEAVAAALAKVAEEKALATLAPAVSGRSDDPARNE